MTLDDLLLFRTGTLSRDMEPDGDEVDPEALVAKINALDPAPPRALAASDVRIYCALVANDQVDAYYTRFSLQALEQVARGIVGMPALRNHNSWQSGDLPVARWFAGEVVNIGGVNWARCWNYMSASADDYEARLLGARIDAGILREVSLSWYQDSMKCSICGRSLWGSDCPHMPGVTDDASGQMCVGEMDSIRSVEEASLVWKGGQYGTEIEPADRTSETKARTMQRVTLTQRIASKRSAQPASAGGSELDAWLADYKVAADTLEDFFKAG